MLGSSLVKEWLLRTTAVSLRPMHPFVTAQRTCLRMETKVSRTRVRLRDTEFDSKYLVRVIRGQYPWCIERTSALSYAVNAHIASLLVRQEGMHIYGLLWS